VTKLTHSFTDGPLGEACAAKSRAFAAYLAPLHKTKWYVYGKRPFGGPKAVLAYLSRYTHRVAISNSRLIAADETASLCRRPSLLVGCHLLSN
jgi:hypothetical protein